MTSQTVPLSGRIILEEDLYTVVIDGTPWCTYSDKPLDALRDVRPMVLEYLRAYEQIGQLEQRLESIGFLLPLADELIIQIGIDVSVVFETPSARLSETVPVTRTAASATAP